MKPAKKKQKRRQKKKVSFKKQNIAEFLKKTDKLLDRLKAQIKEATEDLDLRDVGKELNTVGMQIANQNTKNKKFEKQLQKDIRNAHFNPDGLYKGGRKTRKKRISKRRRTRRGGMLITDLPPGTLVTKSVRQKINEIIKILNDLKKFVHFHHQGVPH